MPSRKGYVDIAFIPRKRSDKPAMIVELKFEHNAKTAINQIKYNDHPQILSEFGNILLVGISYDKKTKRHECIIERQETAL